MRTRLSLAFAAPTMAMLVSAPATAEAQSRGEGEWVMPRTAYGRPDLQGNWSNATLTPIQRPEGQDRILHP
jgi:hypothetical protein